MAIRYGVRSTEPARSHYLVDLDLRWMPVPIPGTFLRDERGQLFVVRGVPLANYETGKQCTVRVRSLPDTYEHCPVGPVGDLEISHYRP